MALPSSSSQHVSSTTVRPKPYDVFLNFRGEDTRNTFVDHLYFALIRLGIHTYRDDISLHKGDIIHPSLKKGIEESQIAVTIFSENYGDSSSCMLELEHIMKCMDEGELIVIPIFYDVTPADVKGQSGKFGVGFAKQLESKNSSKVELWKKVLKTVGGISGWEPKKMDMGREAENTYTIAIRISERLKPIMLDSNTKEEFIGIETRKQELISHLDFDSGGVRMVGIWGIGGSGKTTLASSVYEEIYDKFDSCCFVGNIREASDKYGLERLQEKIVFDALKIQVATRSVEERGWKIRSKLSRKKVLIVLDDVAHHDHLEALAGAHDWFGEGSRIIITTRDQHLLNARKVDVTYNISLLNDEEAIQIFDRHVLWKYRPVEDHGKLSMLSKNVVSYAGGIPLVLKVLGRFLCDKDTSEWMSTLTRLEDIPDSDFHQKLKISYDGLIPMEQEFFLDIACFFRYWPKDEAMMILDACGFHPVVAVKVLIQKALMSITKGMFDMHDVVQEMGYYIVRGVNPENPKEYSRVWDPKDIKKLCATGATMENNKIQALYSGSDDSLPNLLEVVANMKNLRLLDVRQEAKELAEEPLFLSDRLRLIYWENYPASSLPTNFHPTNLVSLKLTNGLQKELWKGYKEIPTLTVLDLRYSKNLTETPDFGGLKNLKRLLLCGCSNLKEIHSSVGLHEKLEYLSLDNCCKLEMFPPIVEMKKLVTLIFSRCIRLEVFPEIHQTMGSLVKLCLDRSGIKIVPFSIIGQYCTRLSSLDLRDCFHSEQIEFHNQRLIRQRCSILVGKYKK